MDCEPSFDAVVVRGDIYTDWIVAMSYGMTHGSWIVQLTPANEDEVLRLIAGLSSFKRDISILIVGAPNAVPNEFEEKLEKMGITVKRVGGATRLDTSLYLVINYWRDCKSLVLVDGFNSSYYLAALSVAVERGAPVIYTKGGKPPEGFYDSLRDQLKEVRSLMVVGSSLSSEDANSLRSSGYSVEFISELNVSPGSLSTSPYYWVASTIRELSSPLPLLIGFALGSLTALLVVRLRRREEVRGFADFLTLDERKLVEVIRERGEVFQEELPELTGFSKPKISRMIAELSDRKVVVREKYGKTYIIRLSDRAKDF
ncbi:MAG: hypothetical protein NZ992_00915 [Candidatus Korarchaeum sp.]|nr:hypothetical protein [Candidatus Korarchaeum sp.]MDW8035405.1 hypothetical protein [Candidatus Korarchaeum sp.]